jgi:ketosteroid isomerase-like protein
MGVSLAPRFPILARGLGKEAPNRPDRWTLRRYAAGMDLEARARELLANFYAAFSTGLRTGWEDSMAEDVIVIGTDDAEWLQGRDRVAPVLQAQMAEMSEAGMHVDADDPQVGVAGSTVWVADQPTLRMADGAPVSMRLTFVATEVDGRLVVKQLHVSVGVPNEEVLNQTLTQ